MSLPGWSPLSRHRPVHELSRDEGSLTAIERRRRESGIEDRNRLSAEEAVAAIKAIRSKALRESFTDSTVLIRADRDGR